MSAEALAKIAASANRLNAATDELLRYVSWVETRLIELHVGLEGEVTSDLLPPLTIGYCRFGRTWRICIKNPRGDFITWGESNRADKLRAIEMLPALIAKLTETAEVMTARSEKALEQVKALTVSMEPQP